MKAPTTLITTGLITLLLSGCAGYKIRAVDPANIHEPGKEGYVFHAPAPFLEERKITAKVDDVETVTYEYKIVYLPDMERPYRFTQYEFLAKSELKIAFEEGWKWTGAESKTDSTAVPSALVELAKSAADAALRTPADSSGSVYTLYRLTWDYATQSYTIGN